MPYNDDGTIDITTAAEDLYDLKDATDAEILMTVLAEVAELRKEHAETVTQVRTLCENVAPHLEQVGPMIDALANNPMFKMLAGGKKK